MLIATPFFVIFGGLSDKIGRRNIMLAGMLLGILLYRPIFQELYVTADTSLKTVASNSNHSDAPGKTTTIKKFADGTQLKTVSQQHNGATITKNEIVLNNSAKWKMILLIAVMVLFVTMVYGPIAAFLVELFPTRIRYTSMSLPYHIGNGVFGGLVPFIATLITTIKGTDHLSGLWYPIGIASLSFVIGLLYLTNKIDRDVTD